MFDISLEISSSSENIVDNKKVNMTKLTYAEKSNMMNT